MSLPVNSQESRLYDDLFDPVSYEPMTDAVTILPCGHVLSKTTAASLKDRNLPCPLDRIPIENFVANHTVRNIVEAMLGKPEELKELKIIPDERVEIGERIGGGSFGAVHKGTWINSPVAIKLLTTVPLDNDTELKKTVEKEARLVATLFHPNITTFFGLLSSCKGFVMELMEESLYDAIKKGKTKPWLPQQRVAVIKGAASGLTYLHEQNIMHRDLKSMNILLKGDTAKLTDFGVSKIKEHTAKTMTGMVGSPSWMAPEVLRGDTDYDKPADIYSLSLILWEIFHEKIPFENLNAHQVIFQIGGQNKKETIAPATPAPLQELMKQSWQEAASRPTASAFLETLATYQNSLPSSEKPNLLMPTAPLPTYNPHIPSTPPMTNIAQHPRAHIPVPQSAFGAADWNTYFGDVGLEPPLPPNIEEILQNPCPFWPGQTVANTHFLCLIPKTVNGKSLTLDNLEKLVKTPKQGNPTQYRYYHPEIQKEYGTKPVEKSYWVLMTKDVIPGSRAKSYEKQKALVEKIASYEMPRLIEAATVIFMHTFKTGGHIYTDHKLGKQYTWTRCLEKIPEKQQWPLVIGGLSAAGLGVYDIHFDSRFGHDCCGAGGTRKLRALTLVPQSAFGAADWDTYFGDVGLEPPLPPNIEEILQNPCPFWPGQKVADTHFLCLIPKTVNGKPLTLDNLEKLVKTPKQGKPTKYSYYWEGIRKEYGSKPVENSYWVLMTKDVIPGSRDQTYEDQKALVEKTAPYEMPRLIEAATVIFMHSFKTGGHIYTDIKLGNHHSWTRCLEKNTKNQWPLVIGGLSAAGLGVDRYSYFSYFRNEGHGVSSSRKFYYVN